MSDPNSIVSQIGDLASAGEKMIEHLRPFVTALPVPTSINVNTAPAEVLAVAVDGLSLEQAQEVVSKRNEQYFAELADFRALLYIPLGIYWPGSVVAAKVDAGAPSAATRSVPAASGFS